MKGKITITLMLTVAGFSLVLAARVDSWFAMLYLSVAPLWFYGAVDLLLKEVKKSTANQQAPLARASGASSVSEA